MCWLALGMLSVTGRQKAWAVGACSAQHTHTAPRNHRRLRLHITIHRQAAHAAAPARIGGSTPRHAHTARALSAQLLPPAPSCHLLQGLVAKDIQAACAHNQAVCVWTLPSAYCRWGCCCMHRGKSNCCIPLVHTSCDATHKQPGGCSCRNDPAGAAQNAEATSTASFPRLTCLLLMDTSWLHNTTRTSCATRGQQAPGRVSISAHGQALLLTHPMLVSTNQTTTSSRDSRKLGRAAPCWSLPGTPCVLLQKPAPGLMHSCSCHRLPNHIPPATHTGLWKRPSHSADRGHP